MNARQRGTRIDVNADAGYGRRASSWPPAITEAATCCGRSMSTFVNAPSASAWPRSAWGADRDRGQRRRKETGYAWALIMPETSAGNCT